MSSAESNVTTYVARVPSPAVAKEYTLCVTGRSGLGERSASANPSSKLKLCGSTTAVICHQPPYFTPSEPVM